MKTVGEILGASSEYLLKKGLEKSRRMSEELLSHVLGMKRIDLYMQFDRPLKDEELSRMRPLIKRAGEGEPIDYILGNIEFFGCRFKVDRRALIPRPETEIMVDLISKQMKGEGSLWDLCTGTGCIGISLKKRLPRFDVSLSDLSSEALALARENALLNDVQVEFYHGDLLQPFQGKKADLIAVNPPYVSVNEYFSLDPSVRLFEPKAALVGGEKGTEFYERLARDLPLYLHPKGKCFLEIGSLQGEAVQEIFSSSVWIKKELLMDWAGKPRFFFLEMQ